MLSRQGVDKAERMTREDFQTRCPIPSLSGAWVLDVARSVFLWYATALLSTPFQHGRPIRGASGCPRAQTKGECAQRTVTEMAKRSTRQRTIIVLV